jgi:N-acetylglucosaminyldiphosphoundecaprenol N-acetyl-beta-D-mannosaminyltransferase
MGEPVDLVTCEEVMRFVMRKVNSGQKSSIANHNSHSLYLIDRHPEMRAFYDRTDLIEADSMPLILWGKLMGEPISRGHRCTYLCWRDIFWDVADRRGWRVYYLGGAPGVAETAAARLRERAPRATIQVRDGFFDMTPGSAENAAILAEINALRPHVLFVGMGMPRQEIWLERNYSALPPCVMLPVGAAFDYEAGVQKAAPRWTGRLGVEWAFRFLSDPTRLFERYFVEPWSLIPLMLQDIASRIAPRPRIARISAPVALTRHKPTR